MLIVKTRAPSYLYWSHRLLIVLLASSPPGHWYVLWLFQFETKNTTCGESVLLHQT